MVSLQTHCNALSSLLLVPHSAPQMQYIDTYKSNSQGCFVVAGILHQNITGESIWLTNSTENADAMLAGFELSCFCTARQHASSLVGDVHFMAPEMFERDYSFPINSHALGVVLYSMLAGQLPYKGMDGELHQYFIAIALLLGSTIHVKSIF